MLVAAVHQRDQDRPQIPAGRGQDVLVPSPLTLGLVGPPLDEALVDQQRQPLGQDVAGDAEVLCSASKRRTPLNRSRTTSTVQRSPRICAVRAIEQVDES